MDGSPCPTIDSRGSTRRLRILVIEDDALLQLLVCEMLIAMGHHVCGAASTEAEAIKAASRSRPDLMIVDAHLGRGSGLAAVGRIIADRWTPHVFVSGDRLASGALDPRAVTLQKPYLEQDLARAMEKAMAA